jgi:hypothetical protein
MAKIKHYTISCQAYGAEVDKLDGTYVVHVKLDNVLDKRYTGVLSPEDGLDVINTLIKDYKFKVYPDLTIYDSKILGRMIVAEN